MNESRIIEKFNNLYISARPLVLKMFTPKHHHSLLHDMRGFFLLQPNKQFFVSRDIRSCERTKLISVETVQILLLWICIPNGNTSSSRCMQTWQTSLFITRCRRAKWANQRPSASSRHRSTRFQLVFVYSCGMCTTGCGNNANFCE